MGRQNSENRRQTQELMVRTLKERQREEQGEVGMVSPDLQIRYLLLENPEQE